MLISVKKSPRFIWNVYPLNARLKISIFKKDHLEICGREATTNFEICNKGTQRKRGEILA